MEGAFERGTPLEPRASQGSIQGRGEHHLSGDVMGCEVGTRTIVKKKGRSKSLENKKKLGGERVFSKTGLVILNSPRTTQNIK